MKRDEVIKNMKERAINITGKNSDNWTREKENEIWGMASSFNSKHYGETGYDYGEIFMSEYYGDNDEMIGFMIEDDYFLYEE